MIRALLAAAVAAICGAGSAYAANCASLTTLNIPNVTITSATLVDAGTSVTSGFPGAAPMTFDKPFCRVVASAHPTSDSNIGMEIWMPLAGAWNGKFEQLGNGGYAGAVRGAQMAPALRRGYAVAATDDGNQMGGDGITAAWALGHPEKIVDFAYRAVNQTTLAAKTIILNFEGAPAKLSYFVGCSTGGREALMSAQRYPLSFDGIIAGAPAAPMLALLARGVQDQRALSKPNAWLSPAKLAALNKASLAACGKGKTYVLDPMACKFDPRSISCRGKETDACLTPPQVATARALYATSKEPGGRVLYGWLPGAEGLKGSWDNWIAGTGPGAIGKAAGEEFARNFYAYMVAGNADIKPDAVTDYDIAKGREMYGAMIEAQSADLSAYKARGGKLIQYHGWNDPAIPARYSVEYFDAAQKQMGDTGDFYRLFMVPGMLHCANGDAPTNVDWLTLLEDWVEHGKAPAQAIAKATTGADTQTLLPRKASVH